MVIMPMQRVATQPHQHNTIADFGLHQQRGGHVGDGRDSDDIQRLFGRILHGKLSQMPRRVRFHGRFFVGQIAFRAAIGAIQQIRAAHQGENILDLVIAFLHANGGRRGLVVAEGRGVNGLQLQLFIILNQIGQGVLIVDFVIGVGIQHHIHRALRALQTAQQRGVIHLLGLIHMEKRIGRRPRHRKISFRFCAAYLAAKG